MPEVYLPACPSQKFSPYERKNIQKQIDFYQEYKTKVQVVGSIKIEPENKPKIIEALDQRILALEFLLENEEKQELSDLFQG